MSETRNHGDGSRAAYYEVLARATDAYRRRGRPDLAPVYDYVVPMINGQLGSMDREEPGADNDEDDDAPGATGADGCGR